MSHPAIRFRNAACIFGILALFSFACTAAKDSDDYRKIATEKATLEEQIRLREQEIEEITGSIGKIDSNLMEISKHVEVMDGVKLRELIKKPGEIDLMITEIGDYVKENNEMVAKLDKKVRESTTVNESLKKMIEMKNQQVVDKETQIGDLLVSIEKMQGEFKGAISQRDSVISNVRKEMNQTKTELTTTQETVKAQENTLNTVFVTFGTKQELAQKGVIQGSKMTLSNQLEDDDFKAVGMQGFEEVDMGITKRQKVVTSHPTDSYYFVKTDGRTFLKIVDGKKFWSVSKYLVVVIDF